MQQALAERSPRSRKTGASAFAQASIQFDVVVRPDGDLYGDGVNVAARLEPRAAPGGILVSAKVHDELHGKLALAWHDRGEQALKTSLVPSGFTPSVPAHACSVTSPRSSY